LVEESGVLFLKWVSLGGLLLLKKSIASIYASNLVGGIGFGYPTNVYDRNRFSLHQQGLKGGGQVNGEKRT
jgi:hypothetical protein